MSKGNALLDGDVEGHLRLVDLNVRGTVHVARVLLPGMVACGSGRVVFTSSIVAAMPAPFQAT